MLLLSRFAKARPYIFATLLGVVSLAFLAAGFWSYHAAQSYVTKVFDRSLESLRTKWHMTVNYGEMHVTAGGVVIEGLNIDSGFQTLIAALSVEWDLNPLSKNFGAPKTLHISKFFSKMRLQEIIALLQSSRDLFAQGRPRNLSQPEHKDLAAYVPREIRIEQGEVAVTDDNNNPLFTCKGVHITKEVGQGELKIGFDTIIFKETVIANEAGIELITSGTGQNGAFPLLANVRKDGENFVIKGEISHNFDSIKLLSKWRNLPFLPAPLKDLLVIGDDSHFAASLKVVGLKDPHNAVITANLIARNVGLNHASISRAPVMFDKIKVLTRSKIDPVTQTIASTGKLTLARQNKDQEDTEGIDVLLGFSKNLKEDLWGTYHVDLELPSSPCEAIKNSLPSAMTTHVSGFELAGNAALKMGLDIDLNNPDAFIYRLGEATFGCSVVKAPDAYSLARMTAQFDARRLNESSVDAGSILQTSDYVPIRDISPNLTSALVASEDAGFFSHKGISWPSMLSALRRNLKDRSISLGGSTITMQMVKNLLLSRERTVCRKLEEIFLAWYVEKILPKDKILEIYANIIEYGPDLYGIGRATRRFFGKTPSELSVIESAYIATLLPNPKARYIYFCQNRLSENFKGLVNANVQKMYEQNMISDAGLDEGLKGHLKFAQPRDAGPGAECQRNLASFESLEQESLRVEF